MRATYSQNQSLMKLDNEMNVSAIPGDTDKWANDKSKQDRFEQWLKNLRTDIYLDQAVKVVGDVISQQNTAKAKTGTEVQKKAF